MQKTWKNIENKHVIAIFALLNINIELIEPIMHSHGCMTALFL